MGSATVATSIWMVVEELSTWRTMQSQMLKDLYVESKLQLTKRITKDTSTKMIGIQTLTQLERTSKQMKSCLTLKTKKMERNSLTIPSISKFDVQKKDYIYKKRDYV